MSDFVTCERLSSIQAVEDMGATASACFRAALKHDGLPLDAKFAVFSTGNPFVQFYERAMLQFFEMAKACAVHGYCGLSMFNRELYKPKSNKRVKRVKIGGVAKLEPAEPLPPSATEKIVVRAWRSTVTKVVRT